jgi:hypothetical protein
MARSNGSWKYCFASRHFDPNGARRFIAPYLKMVLSLPFGNA